MDVNELQLWQAVPDRVAKLLPVAAGLKLAHTLAAGEDPVMLARATVTWQPETNTVTVGMPHETPGYRQKFAECFPACTLQFSTDSPADTILIKQAWLPYVASAVDNTQKALGGPTPLTNALVTGLLAGGVGYGAGALAENLFPERYLERGKLRRTLAATGALGGLGMGAMNAYSNARMQTTPSEFAANPLGQTMRGFLMRNDAPPALNRERPQVNHVDMPQTQERTAGYYGQLDRPLIPVQQFNNMAWRDTQLGMRRGFDVHTPPAYTAAATGFMTGLSAGKQSPLISPADVINGIASAGIGMVTANMAGRALSALAGLTPAGQEKLQDMGMWGGMMHAIVPPMLGMR